jgi:sulfite reductase (NADPH) hemoprotein beta-component
MYQYDKLDQTLVDERVEQFRDQVRRRMAGELNDDEFRPLRLMNGVYLQLHAYMFRISIPYGMLSTAQLRKLAFLARTYDRDYGHFTTRQNIQFNWPKLKDIPDMLAHLASVQMHAIQTSGNSFRNTTSDQYAGAAAGEVDDPRIYCEIIRQWSTLHPEFSFLPRKFKIAVTGSVRDRAAVKIHDIGIIMKRNEKGELGFEMLAGGGLGRTPFVGKTVRQFCEKKHLLSYLTAMLRIYNQLGRRDNIFKARIKILVHELGIEKYTELVEKEWEQIKDDPALHLPDAEIERVRACFPEMPYAVLDDSTPDLEKKRLEDKDFDLWVSTNTAAHKKPGYAIVNLSLKPIGGIPGDCTADQMDAVADMADKYSFGELRVSHHQNLVLADVRKSDLYEVWQKLKKLEMATPNMQLITDIICCPGLDYCGLANSRSIPVAQRISNRFADLKRQHDIGELQIKMSGCINACGQHHIGHIGLLGVDRKNEEYYQITLGGSPDEKAAIGTIVGPAVSSAKVVDAVETLVNTYLEIRQDGERFLDTVNRVGIKPFKEKLYAAA